MSLRAKIEAVIYAAEEPVTLAQLAALFAAEALTEREARGSQPDSGASFAFDTATRLPFAAATGTEAATVETAEAAALAHQGAPADDLAIEQAVEHPEQVAVSQADGFVEPSGEGGESEPAIDEGKRLARARDREVREEIRRQLEALIAEYDNADRGMEIREIAGGYRVATKPEYHDAVRGFVKSLKPPMKLTLQALETLAVIAYKQPVTAPEVSEIRGVDSGGVLGSLISRKLVTTAGRKQVIGRPILYKTTKEFLLRFGLKDVTELPSMEEFEKMAGELAEREPSGSQMELARTSEQRGAQGDEALPTSESTATRLDEDPPDQPVEPAERDAEPAVPEASSAEEVQAAPEFTEALEHEELAAKARAAVRIDEENEGLQDLAGVTRDTAGRVNIDRRAHTPLGGASDDEES